MAQTKLQLVNRILRRLREDEATTTADTSYTKLIVDFINEAKREVEDEWDWLNQRATTIITTVASTFRYTLTGSGDRARLIIDPNKGSPWLDIFDTTNDNQLKLAPSAAWMTRQKLFDSPTNGQPLWVDIPGTDGTDLFLDIEPTPDAVYVVHVQMSKPQADFGQTAADDATTLTVPDYSVFLRSLELARDERGEDVNQLHDQYLQALNDGIAMERDVVQAGMKEMVLVG